ncbi:MAG: MotA/TolQ/ExbB proton channel family protein [Vicinamibacteria bacterium]|nr:MotA/TolQ/ExbB proton channel family protein [Vicinamibacteria bacterium]
MSSVAIGVVVCLLLMSIWSVAIIFDRWRLFKNARAQSRKYAADVARLLKAGKLKEAVDLSGSVGMKSSHLAKVALAGLQEWQFQGASGETDKDTALEASKRAMQRATAVNLAELKKGLAFLATTGATAPFVGLFGTTVGIINAFAGMSLTGSGGIGAIAGGISEALITTALGLLVAIAAVWAYNYFAGQVDGFTVEMDNSGSELLDFVKKIA